MSDFLNFHKQLLLDFSMQLANELKSDIRFVDTEYEQLSYDLARPQIPNLYLAALLEQTVERLYICADSRIIYALCNRMLGGKGCIETQPDSFFTDSELFFGETFFDTLIQQYAIFGKGVELIRTETQEQQSQVFFTDQVIHLLKSTCLIGDNKCGPLLIFSADRLQT